MNFNQSTNSLLNQSDTTCANQSTSSSHFNQSAAVTYNSFSTVEAPSRTDFSFDYKLNNDSGVIQTQSARDKFSSSVPDSSEEADVIDQFPDDLFSPDDFDSEFTEEVKTDSLPQLSSPRRQSTNQSFGKPVIVVIRDFKTTPVIFIYRYFMFCESFQEISGKIIFMFLLVLLHNMVPLVYIHVSFIGKLV